MGTLVQETDDAGTFDTPYRLTAGDSFAGSISTDADVDYIALTVEAGKTYQLELTPSYSLWAGDLRLMSETLGFVVWGGMREDGHGAVLKFQAQDDGVLFAEAGLKNRGVGKYTMTFEENAGFAPWTLQEAAAYLTTGYWIDQGETPAVWRFADDGSPRILTYDPTDLGVMGARYAALAFQAWSDISGLMFQVSSDAPDIVLTRGGQLSYTDLDRTGSTITHALVNVAETHFPAEIDFDAEELAVLIHEIGHVLGLGHGGPYNFSGTYEVDALHAADTFRYSAMSYFGADKQAFVDLFDWTPISPMAADILAIEALYGAVTQNTGDTVYGVGVQLDDLALLPDGYIGRYIAAAQDLLGYDDSGYRELITIKDDGGHDLFDFSRSLTGETLDVTIAPEGSVTVVDPTLVLMEGTVIEDVNGGAFSDTITGNAVANRIEGNAGNDWIDGRGGDDTLSGGNGDDTLLGGEGDDRLEAGSGANLVDGRAGFDRYVLDTSGALSPHVGPVTVDLAAGFALAEPLGVADTLVSVEAATVIGEADVRMVGTRGANALETGAGDDTLTGGQGRDTLASGGGIDLVTGDSYEAAMFTRDEGAQIFRLYDTVLGRTPDRGGFETWSETLGSGTDTLQSAAAKFTKSAEFQAEYGALPDTDFVELLYRNVFGRAADASGLDHWLGRLQSGTARETVVYHFSESAEHKAGSAEEFDAYLETLTAQGRSDDVYRLYKAALGRDPDLAGFESWTQALCEGAALEAVAHQFTSGAEALQTFGVQDDSAFVARLYDVVLGRTGGASEVASWTTRIEDGLTRAGVLLGFAQSEEYIAATKAGLARWVGALGWHDTIFLDGGETTASGGVLGDLFVIRQSGGGQHTVIDVEAWDALDLSSFAYADTDTARAYFKQDGDDVVFADLGVTVILENWSVGDIADSMLLL